MCCNLEQLTIVFTISVFIFRQIVKKRTFGRYIVACFKLRDIYNSIRFRKNLNLPPVVRYLSFRSCSDVCK